MKLSQAVAGWLTDLWRFKTNAEENRRFRRLLAERSDWRFQMEDLRAENARLSRLLGLRPGLRSHASRAVFSRVIARSPSAWNRVLLIDKGTRDGIQVNQAVLSDLCLIGKVIETGPSVSKVLLVTDPNCKIGVLIQRTRQQGILFGSLSGECRVKYLSLDDPVQAGDIVETAGFGDFFPKGFKAGTVVSSRKEPGQMYQVATVRSLVDLDRVEEVACVR